MKPKKPDSSFETFSQNTSARVKKLFSDYLQQIPAPELKAAMEYSLLSAGKFLRPLLIFATGNIFAAPLENLDIPACAIEMIHTYSLIHDDLPAMDNADLRRGKPACHKAFNEALAILAGDGLLTLALEVVARHPAPLPAQRRLQMINVLTHASGAYGMVAGQTLDISTTETNILDIYRMKTGALFTACMELGWLSSTDEDDANRVALKEFGDCIGLAFQIQDDILDIEASTEVLGKTRGTDQANAKNTYPQIHGIDPAKQKVQNLYTQAFSAIDRFGSNAQLLREVTDVMLQRQK